MLIALLTLGCTPAADSADTAAIDTSTDTSGDTNNDSAGDTSTDTSGDTSEDTSADTGTAPLPGNVEVTGNLDGTPFAFSCDASSDAATFSRYWSNSLGNIAGSFGCVGQGSLTVSFMNPRSDTWSAPTDGMSFVYTGSSGAIYSGFDPTPSAWSLTLTDAEYLTPTTLLLSGTLGGTWETSQVAGTFSLQIACNNCD